VGRTTIDQVMFRRSVEEFGAPWHIEELGLKREHLEPDVQAAWEFVESYMKENHGEIPSDELIVYEMGWNEVPLEDLPAGSVKYFATEIKRREVQGQLNDILDEVDFIMKGGGDSVFEAQSRLIELVDDLRAFGLTRISAVNIFDLYPKVEKNYEQYQQGDVGIETPWPTMTESILGFQLGHVVYFVARPQTGKTWALLRTAMHCYDSGHRVLMVTPELTEDECAERLACMQAHVSYSAFTRGRLDPYAEDRLKKHIEECKELNGFWVSDSTMEFDKTEVEALVSQFDPDVIAVDSIYCFGDGRNRNERIANASPWLIELARKHGRKRLVLATSQMNRKAINAETTTIENIYGSDAVGQDAHVIYGLFASDEMYRDKRLGMTQLKVRRGVRHDPFYCNWDLDVMDFGETRTNQTGYEREEDEDDDAYNY